MYTKNNNYEESVMDNTIVLMNSEDGSVHILNETAASIWRQLESNTVDNIIDSMLQKYVDVDKTALANDVHRTIESFIEKGLIVEVVENE